MCVVCNAAPVPRDGSLMQLAFLDTLPPDWLPACDVPLFLLHKHPQLRRKHTAPSLFWLLLCYLCTAMDHGGLA